VSGSLLGAFEGLNVGFTASNGTVSSGSSAIASGLASTSFNAAATAGAGSVMATFDNASVNVPIGVATAPQITTSFATPTVGVQNTVAVHFDIQNSLAFTATDISFDDTLPAGLEIAATPNVTNTCGGTITANGGGTTITLSGGSVAASQTCSITVDVLATSAGSKSNSATVASGSCGGNTSTASLTVLQTPTIAKSFDAATIPIGGSAFVTFTIANPNAATDLTGVGFVDNLPPELRVDTPNDIDNQCSGTVTAAAGGTSIALSGASLAANTQCTVQVRITGVIAGLSTNTTNAVVSNEAGAGNTASDTITVTSCTYVLTPTSNDVTASATSGIVGVQTTGTCDWTAISDVPWLTTSSSGTGDGTVSYNVAANASFTPRAGTIRIGGQTFTVHQTGVQPSNLEAHATSTTVVHLTWSADIVPGVQFKICRWTSPSLTCSTIVPGTSYDDTVAAGAAYVYAIVATDGANDSTPSNRDLAITRFFAEAIATGGTINATQLIDDREIIELVRTAAGATSPYPYSQTAATNLAITPSTVNEMVAALSDAFTTLSLPSLSLAVVQQNDPVTAAWRNLLRDALH